MRTLRPKEVQDHTTSKWRNQYDFRAQGLPHPWGSEESAEITSDGAGIWTQAFLIPRPTCFITTRLCCLTPSAGQNQLLTTLRIHPTSWHWQISTDLSSSPPNHILQPLWGLPGRFSTIPGWSGLLPSFSQPPPWPTASLSRHLPIRTRNYSYPHAPSGEVVVCAGLVSGIDGVHQCVSYGTKFILYIFYVSCQPAGGQQDP